MALSADTPVRVIKFKDETLVDPNPDASIDDVVKILAATRPELATANVEGPEYKDGKQIYTLGTRLGSKG